MGTIIKQLIHYYVVHRLNAVHIAIRKKNKVRKSNNINITKPTENLDSKSILHRCTTRSVDNEIIKCNNSCFII